MQSPSPAANEQIKITGCYSSLSYHEESGDLLGWEFFIVYSADAYHVLFQESEGWPTVLLLLPVEVNGCSISFTIPGADESRRFTGEVSAEGLKGSFGNGPEVVLERKDSYWQ